MLLILQRWIGAPDFPSERAGTGLTSLKRKRGSKMLIIQCPSLARTRSRAEGDGRSAANQCCDMKADLATIGPEATLKARWCVGPKAQEERKLTRWAAQLQRQAISLVLIQTR